VFIVLAQEINFLCCKQGSFMCNDKVGHFAMGTDLCSFISNCNITGRNIELFCWTDHTIWWHPRSWRNVGPSLGYGNRGRCYDGENKLFVIM